MLHVRLVRVAGVGVPIDDHVEVDARAREPLGHAAGAGEDLQVHQYRSSSPASRSGALKSAGSLQPFRLIASMVSDARVKLTLMSVRPYRCRILSWRNDAKPISRRLKIDP